MKEKIKSMREKAQRLNREIDNQIEFMESLPSHQYDSACRYLDGLMRNLSALMESIEDMEAA